MTNIEKRMRELVDDINVHGAILIMGAGCSFEVGMPLYAQFYPIIWQLLDKYPKLKIQMGYSASIEAKKQIGENQESIKNFFDCLESNSDALNEFKDIFSRINNKHCVTMSPVHLFLSKMIHSGLIKLVISFNWDDVLERAWTRLYGTDINSTKIQLLKPHGSVHKLDEEWVFPNSDGRITDSDLEIINAAKCGIPITLIIMGYSESDSQVVESIISPSDAESKVYRISPNAQKSIPLKTSDAIKYLHQYIVCEDNTYCENVDYNNQVGLEHAIMGYRLLPADVSACARLPQISDIKLRLHQAHSVIIKGEPGCGKSITAYQVGYDFMQLGWEVIKIKKLESHLTLHNNGYKTVYILDDAQQYDDHVISNLLNKANKHNKVIVTQTISTKNHSESVVITQSEAVKAIYDHYLENAKEVVEIIREPNKRIGREIGDLLLQSPLHSVLDVALREKTPWLFNYSLRGGWAETRNQYNIAKEYKDAHILLVIISLYQILSLDKPVAIKYLYTVAIRFGFDHDWVNTSLDYLLKQKMIIDQNEIRVLHLQNATRILARHTEEVSNNKDDPFYSLVREEITSDHVSLKGVYWLYDLFFGYDVNWIFIHNTLSEETNKKLLEICLGKNNPEEISQAAYVIERVLHRNGLKYRDLIDEHGDILRKWLNEVNSTTARGLAEMLNDMANDDRRNKESFVCSLNRVEIATNLKTINQDSLYAWGYFLSRFAIYNNKKWNMSFYSLLPRIIKLRSEQHARPHTLCL